MPRNSLKKLTERRIKLVCLRCNRLVDLKLIAHKGDRMYVGDCCGLRMVLTVYDRLDILDKTNQPC